MFGIGVQELGLILVIALLVFGPKRMPELARMLGRGMGEFRKASNDLRQSLALDEIQNELRDAAGSIHKPLQEATQTTQATEEPDRPAQAGDDLPPSGADSKPASDAAQTSETSNQDAPVETSSESAPPSGPHPGELPLDNDYEHHANPDDALEGASDPDAGNDPRKASSKSSEPERG